MMEASKVRVRVPEGARGARIDQGDATYCRQARRRPERHDGRMDFLAPFQIRQAQAQAPSAWRVHPNTLPRKFNYRTNWIRLSSGYTSCRN